MKNTSTVSYKGDYTKNFQSSSGKRSFAYEENRKIHSPEERLLSLKIQEITEELNHIVSFTRELRRFWFDNTEVVEQIESILAKLNSRDRSYKYTEIVRILSNYLQGVRNFCRGNQMKNVLSYKQLFESALVAVIWEIDSLEEALR